MKPVKVGVVGIGNMGIHHARVYSELPQTDLVGVVDIDEERGRQLAADFNTQHFTDYRDLLEQGVEAVNIVVPTVLHFPLAADFLRAGVHVLVEKPITADLIQAKKLIELAEQNERVLQVGHLERFNPAVLKLKECVENPINITAKRVSYKTDRNLDVGVVWDLMIHDLDILLYLIDSRVVDINAFGVSVYSDFEDIAQVQLMFENGVIAHLEASRIGGERERTLSLVDVEGYSMVLDFIEQTLTKKSKPDSGVQPKVEAIEVHKAEPLKLELENFSDCIAHHRTPLVSGEDGRRALSLAIQVLAKMKMVKVDPDKLNELVPEAV